MSVFALPGGLLPVQTEPWIDRAFLNARYLLYTMRRMWWKSLWNLAVRGLENLPRRGPMILCSNHTSHLDAPAILASLPVEMALDTRTAAAADVFGDFSLLGIWGKLATNCIPVERNADYALGLRQLETVLRERRPLVMFPEGGRSQNGKLMEFKLGASLLSMRTGAPVIPVRIRGTYSALPRESWLPCPSDVTVCFGEPIHPEPYKEAVAAGRYSRKASYARMTEDLRNAIKAIRLPR